MRLPLQILESLAFSAGSVKEIVLALGDRCSKGEEEEITRLYEAGLPPVTSLNAIAVMIGYHPSFVWSLLNRTYQHYRVFEIPKGRSTRQIEAPYVALKIVQKWLSVHFERKWDAHEAVHGFVRGRSHITAARMHQSAEWVASLDIENFFPSTPEHEVRKALSRLGYRSDESKAALCRLLCFHGRLTQGSPTSPVISNIALHPIDAAIAEIASNCDATFTRYADDIVFSGRGVPPKDLIGRLKSTFERSVWRLSERKVSVVKLPQRLKVHGLLVHGEKIRLTKGYRNRVRAYRHLYEQGKIREEDIARIQGHLRYASQIESSSGKEDSY